MSDNYGTAMPFPVAFRRRSASAVDENGHSPTKKPDTAPKTVPGSIAATLDEVARALFAPVLKKRQDFLHRKTRLSGDDQ